MVAFTPQASPAETATISPSFTFQLAIPATSCGERTQSIIVTPGIEKDTLDDICTRPTSPTISGVRRRSAVVAAICLSSDTSSSGRRMESAVSSVAALTPRINTSPIPLLVHPIGCRRYALVLRQFPQVSEVNSSGLSTCGPPFPQVFGMMFRLPRSLLLLSEAGW